jgi:aminoglycoside phosphotransferase (APT) family kinase protein
MKRACERHEGAAGYKSTATYNKLRFSDSRNNRVIIIHHYGPTLFCQLSAKNDFDSCEIQKTVEKDPRIIDGLNKLGLKLEHIKAILPGGAANTVLHISDGHQELVVKIPGGNQVTLNPFCHLEIRNSIVASNTGVVPVVEGFLDSTPAMASRYIPGSVPSLDYLRSPLGIREAMRVFDMLHRGPAFSNDFSCRDLICHYLQVIDEKCLSILPETKTALERSLNLATKYEQKYIDKVPCHNDAMPKNLVLDDESKLWLVDLEFSGNNDPAFDLATLWNESGLKDEQLNELVWNYLGKEDSLFSARVWLLSIVVDGLWSAYAEIQSYSGSFQEFYATKRRERALRCIKRTESPSFSKFCTMLNIYP